MIRRYHDGTKHHFHRFAQSLGYLDWATQPDPFRSFAGAPASVLPPHPAARPLASPIGSILRRALGLTAWKQYRDTTWSLRANPSSGNLHPTEAYVILGPTAGLSDAAGVYHYAPDRHALERRCRFEAAIPADAALVALTSIHWREAWKYGERAFRYCQHDLGHAIAAIAIAASLDDWQAALVADWPHAAIATLTGIDRDEDYADAEREEPGCVIALSRHGSAEWPPSVASLLDGVRAGEWSGRPNRLSRDHVQWSFIDEIAAATRDPGRPHPTRPARPGPLFPVPLLLQRRSAVALDGRSRIDANRFLAMLARVMPDDRAPWSAIWWSARIHLALFVHRVDGIEPGLYLLPREARSGDRLKAALGRDFSFEAAAEPLPLIRLASGDCRRLSQRVSCDQEIAADGFFSLGMLADFDASLEEFGPSFYRHLFWESGIVGQVLYLAAEEAGARGTGIGCFYDDPVHEVLGLAGHAFQSLYHFTIGMPVEDTRLMTRAGYGWEEGK